MMKRFAVLFALLALPPLSAHAVDSVKGPNVTEGQYEYEYKGAFRHDQAAAKNDEKEVETNIAYGVTDRWKTKIEASFEQKRNSDLTYKSTKFENVLNMNGNDSKSKVIWGLYNDVSFADRSDSTHTITFGVLAKRDVGALSNLGNLYVKKDWGDTAKNGFSFMARWQSKYAVTDLFQPGFEMFYDTRTNDRLRDQSLMVGPGIFGNFEIFGKKGWGYDVVYLLGATPASPDGQLKWKLKYTFTL